MRCPDCDYTVEWGSPRYTGPQPDWVGSIKLTPWALLEQSTRDTLDACHKAAKEIATWPSWKVGRCNCPPKE